MNEPEIISDPDAIDAPWLTAVLQHAGIDARVSGFTAETVGTGQVGENVRFTLEGTGTPASIVGKFPSRDPVSRQTGIDQQNYVREVFFYQTLQETVDIATPNVLFAEANPPTHDFVIVMEDLAPAVQGDQIGGCNIDEAALALEQLARLQGRRWGDRSLADYPLLAGTAAHPELLKQIYDALAPGFIERYEARLSAAEQSIVQRVGEALLTYNDVYEGPPGLIHIDYRLDNMMFGGPRPLTVVDWQSISLGCPVNDAAYFLGTSLSPEARASEERHLLRHYVDVLKSYHVDLTEDECWRYYRNYAPAGLIMAVIASMIVGQTDRGDDMFMAMAQRSARMCLEIGAD